MERQTRRLLKNIASPCAHPLTHHQEQNHEAADTALGRGSAATPRARTTDGDMLIGGGAAAGGGDSEAVAECWLAACECEVGERQLPMSPLKTGDAAAGQAGGDGGGCVEARSGSQVALEDAGNVGVGGGGWRGIEREEACPGSG